MIFHPARFTAIPIIRPFRSAVSVAFLVLSGSSGYAEDYYSKRGLFDYSTGYLESYVGRDWYRGTGVIARDPRLIYSCGHLFYENGIWATDYVFYRAYHGFDSPDPAKGASPRGFRYFSNYSNNVDIYGGDSSRSFAYDFTVFYGESFGQAAGTWTDGSAVLRSDRKKRIVGYPATIEHTGASGYAYQYATDAFTRAGYQIRDAYHGFDDVSTGEGNSGGPIFVWDASDNDYYLAGVLVSGSYNTAGIYALNASSNSMASAALGLRSVSRTFRNEQALLLPDAGTSYSTRAISASGFKNELSAVRFSMSVTTPRRGDLNIYLKSPGGRVRWINKASSSTSDNVVIKQADYSTKFRGYTANGEWQLRMRDTRARNRATFNQFSITLTAEEE